MKTQKEHKVVLFTTSSCSWCRKVKQYLQTNRIRFKEIDVARDERAGRDMVRMTGQTGVPVVLIDNRPIVGFDKAKINRMLGIQ
jgi:glutaredoxin-like YruB-family protein